MPNQVTKKSINISSDLVSEIEKAIETYPGLNFTLVVNQALEQWLLGPQKIELGSLGERFIKDNSKGFGPTANRKK
ncbi:MAG: hypothetical protein ACPGJV_04515 [Bacteriovoracaceae bacterium]